ncbi:oxygenase MpaB family protein [Nocardia gamkensis]|uniref:oxygenase MpaB family protein n=1 Tax=Nocardia gamkensis TaxID=352869 RepID=UPI003402C8AE
MTIDDSRSQRNATSSAGILESNTDFIIPRRFGSAQEDANPSLRRLSRLVRGDIAPSDTEKQHLARAVATEDKVGGELARAILVDETVTMLEFRQALKEGIDTLDDPAEPLVKFFAEVETRPPWVDDQRLARGAAACLRTGRTGFEVLSTGSLMSGYHSSAVTRQLIATGRLVGDNTGPRVAETVRWWYECIRRDGMDRNNQGWQLSVYVRLMHAFVNLSLLNDKNLNWDFAEFGMPVNQFDQAGTLGLFSTTYLLGVRGLGVWISAEEGRDVMHLWRYIGYLMGIEERWLVDDENPGRRLMCQILMFAPGPDLENAPILARSLAQTWGEFNYPWAQQVRRRVDHHRMLSIQRMFSGTHGMNDLGLPNEAPWYPRLALAGNGIVHGLARLSPALSRRLTRRADHWIATWLARNEPKRR